MLESQNHPERALSFSTPSQIAHREKIVTAWGVRPGQSVLEIGCGQGDCTIALAASVGPGGRVLALDSAGPTYGEPQSLAQAHGEVAASRIGGRVTFMLNTDLSLDDSPIRDATFDWAVLCHAAWYFDSVQRLRQLLECLAGRANRLGIAEWSLLPRSLDQLPHLAAVLVQSDSLALGAAARNIRTVMTERVLIDAADSAGWRVLDTQSLDPAPTLEDGAWEIANALEMLKEVSVDDRERVEFTREFLLTALQRGHTDCLPIGLLVAGSD